MGGNGGDGRVMVVKVAMGRKMGWKMWNKDSVRQGGGGSPGLKGGTALEYPPFRVCGCVYIVIITQQ